MHAPDQSITLAFVGYATAAMAERATAFEDEVLRLLAGHGAQVLYRGRRRSDDDESPPLEVQLLRFPGRDALATYLADDRRARLLSEYGDVFTRKHAVEIATVERRSFWAQRECPTRAAR